MDQSFESFSLQHVSVLLVFIMLTLVLIFIGLESNPITKKRVGLGIAMLAFGALLIEAIFKISLRVYNLLEDLPFFMCDLVAFILPWVMLRDNRKWIGILYFWALAGTLQALITPELEHGFPSFYFFRYFVMHAAIVSAVVYHVVVHKVRIGWKDFLNAVLFAQFYLVIVHIINLILGSNYSYTVRKPKSETILNVMGDWPWYILLGECLMIVLFLILLTPFLFRRRERARAAE